MTVKLAGYSERGMVNALCSDILHSTTSIRSLESLLSLCKFPFASPDFAGIREATILVEQGFSTFGDLDLLVLLDHGDFKQSILLEAKVATETGNPNRLRSQWQGFYDFLNGDKTKRSNLFVQLYRKMRLMRHLDNRAVILEGDAAGTYYALGTNSIVLKAARLLEQYRQRSWYVALVPDADDEARDFFTTTLATFTPQHDLPEWHRENISKWGYLTWPSVASMCNGNPTSWARAVHSFQWNENQIFGTCKRADTTDGTSIVVNSLYRRKDGVPGLFYAVFANAGQRNCRVVPATFPGEYFPMALKIAKASLEIAGDAAPVLLSDLRPLTGGDYLWAPPSNESIDSLPRATVPSPPQKVRVIRHGWDTSRVRIVDDSGLMQGNEFQVITRHLKRGRG